MISHCYATQYGELGESISIAGTVSVRAMMDTSRPLSTHMLGSLTAGKDTTGSRMHVGDGHGSKFSLQATFKGPVDHKSPVEGWYYEVLPCILRPRESAG